MRISDWSSDVCSSDLRRSDRRGGGGGDRRWRADARSRRYALDHGDGRCGACRARMTAERIELAVVIPTFNEAANVAALVARLDTALSGRIWEAIVVHDNLPDGTKLGRPSCREQGCRYG